MERLEEAFSKDQNRKGTKTRLFYLNDISTYPIFVLKTEHIYTLTHLIYFIAVKKLSTFSQPNLILGFDYFSSVSNYSLSYITIPRDNRKIKFKPKINYR